MSNYTTTNTTSLTLEKFNTEPVMTIHPDGRVTVTDKLKPNEAAAKVVEAFKTRWMADPQATKIRELQSNLNESNELIEYLRDKIKHLKREIELFREHADYGYVCLVEAILKGEEIGRKEKESKPCIYCMKVECECSDFDVSADMGAKG